MKSYKTIDKSEWPRGPWDSEPDKAQWVYKGLDCMIVRGLAGALCGYVGVPEGHPAFGKHYNDVNVEVHGGLTFADSCYEPTREQYDKLFEKLDPQMVAEAVRYPEGDAALRIEKIKLERAMSFDVWVEYQMTRRICHHVEEGRPKKVWWIGFDCAHSGDVMPKYDKFPNYYGTYKSMAFVTREVLSLAKQLA